MKLQNVQKKMQSFLIVQSFLIGGSDHVYKWIIGLEERWIPAKRECADIAEHFLREFCPAVVGKDLLVREFTLDDVIPFKQTEGCWSNFDTAIFVLEKIKKLQKQYNLNMKREVCNYCPARLSFGNCNYAGSTCTKNHTFKMLVKEYGSYRIGSYRFGIPYYNAALIGKNGEQIKKLEKRNPTVRFAVGSSVVIRGHASFPEEFETACKQFEIVSTAVIRSLEEARVEYIRLKKLEPKEHVQWVNYGYPTAYDIKPNWRPKKNREHIKKQCKIVFKNKQQKNPRKKFASRSSKKHNLKLWVKYVC